MKVYNCHVSQWIQGNQFTDTVDLELEFPVQVDEYVSLMEPT